jgi:xylulokinase
VSGDEAVAGVDLGTTGTRAAIYTVAGEPIAEATAPTPLRWSGPGRVEQEPDDFYAAATGALAQCVARAGIDPARVRGVAVSGQMAGILGVDAEHAPSTPYDSWLDTRCVHDVEVLDAELGDELCAVSGCPAMVNHGPKIRWWRRERPEAFAATAKWVTPGGYVAGRLTGLRGADAFIDRTYLHFTALADTSAARWSARLARAAGAEPEQLPRIVEPTTVIGELTGRAAADCGLRPGTPVAAGLGDTAAATLGAGVVRPGQLLDVAGTAAVLAGSATDFRPDIAHRTLITMRGAVPGQWVSLAYLSGGPLLGWLAELVLGAQAGEEGAATPQALERLSRDAAAVPPGADGLLFLPFLDGRLLPSEPHLRGSFVGLQRHHARGHLARAALEGVALEYAEYLTVLHELHPDRPFDEARVSGGGARSDVWNAIKASVLGVPCVSLRRSELGCWGAALAAAAACGLVSDMAAAAEAATPPARTFAPDTRAHALYRQLMPVRRDLVRATIASSRAVDAATCTQEVLA